MFHVSTSIHVNSVLLRLVHTAYVFYLVNITLCLFHPSVVLYASPHICIAFIHLVYASMHLCGHFASCGRSMSSLNVALNQMMGDDMMWPDMVWKKHLMSNHMTLRIYTIQHYNISIWESSRICQVAGALVTGAVHQRIPHRMRDLQSWWTWQYSPDEVWHNCRRRSCDTRFQDHYSDWLELMIDKIHYKDIKQISQTLNASSHQILLTSGTEGLWNIMKYHCFPRAGEKRRSTSYPMHHTTAINPRTPHAQKTWAGASQKTPIQCCKLSALPTANRRNHILAVPNAWGHLGPL